MHTQSHSKLVVSVKRKEKFPPYPPYKEKKISTNVELRKILKFSS